jgi:hypothetical protein
MRPPLSFWGNGGRRCPSTVSVPRGMENNLLRLRAQFGRCDAEEAYRLNTLLDSLVKQGDMGAIEALMREFGVSEWR